MNQPRRAFLGSAAAALGVLSASPLLAQQSPKQRGGRGYGQGFWSNQKSSQHTRHARNFSGNFYQYATTVPQIDPSFAQAQSAEIQRNLETARQDLNNTRKQTEGDKEVQRRLAAIDQHLAKALEHHREMHAECCKSEVDTDASMHCCNDLLEELDRAIMEQDALERLLQRPGTAKHEPSAAAR